MQALEPLQKEEVSASVIRGQYKAGIVQGKPVIGYTSEPGIAPTSMNDTFIAKDCKSMIIFGAAFLFISEQAKEWTRNQRGS